MVLTLFLVLHQLREVSLSRRHATRYAGDDQEWGNAKKYARVEVKSYWDKLPEEIKQHIYRLAAEEAARDKKDINHNTDFWGGFLTIILDESFPYFKFLTKINSKLRWK